MADINIGAISEALNNKVDLPMGDSQDGIDFVVDWQSPTAQNGYTWYRKYKSGWVEQGGYYVITWSSSTVVPITLPIVMADTKYIAMRQTEFVSNGNSYAAFNNGTWEPATRKTTTSFSINQEGTSWGPAFVWRVEGMAAN